jgi:hypothetical protein
MDGRKEEKRKKKLIDDALDPHAKLCSRTNVTYLARDALVAAGDGRHVFLADARASFSICKICHYSVFLPHGALILVFLFFSSFLLFGCVFFCSCYVFSTLE